LLEWGLPERKNERREIEIWPFGGDRGYRKQGRKIIK